MNANNEEFDTTKCAACGKGANDDVKLKQCSACKLVAYCNVTCQKAHRKEHKEDCKREVRFARRRARMQHECVYSFEPGEDVGFVYTTGIKDTHPSKVEFITLNVSKDDLTMVVSSLFNFLAERLLDGHEVRPYQNVALLHGKFSVLPLEEGDKKKLLENYACECDEDTNLLLLVDQSNLPLTLPANATASGEEKVVGEKSIIVNKIREKWGGSFFIRHVDGNTLNNHIMNLMTVSPYDAFTHPEWKVDWVCYLEDDEIAFVRENMDLFAALYKP